MAEAASFASHNALFDDGLPDDIVLNPLPAQQKQYQLPATRPCRTNDCLCGGGVGMCSDAPENVSTAGGSRDASTIEVARADSIRQEKEILRQLKHYPDFTKDMNPLKPAAGRGQGGHGEALLQDRSPDQDRHQEVSERRPTLHSHEQDTRRGGAHRPSLRQ